MQTDTQRNEAIVFFDGMCNLCNASVQFIIKRDKKDYFRFVQLQSTFAEKLLKQYHVKDKTSVLLLENERIYEKSTAALRIAKNLSGGCFILYPLIFINKRLRDKVYEWIARNRYKWFGRRNQCMMPVPGLQHKFLDV